MIDPQIGDLSKVPYAEPIWLTPQFRTPYYNSKHHSLQQAMRRFVETHIKPEAQEKELSGEWISQALIDKMAEANILAMRMGTSCREQVGCYHYSVCGIRVWKCETLAESLVDTNRAWQAPP